MRDLISQVFGRLTIIKRAPNLYKRGSQWECRCECGKTSIVLEARLMNGNTKSCGCRRGGITHGHTRNKGSKSPTYSSWQAMVGRCLYPSNPAYAHYQKRGITICERWQRSGEGALNGFECFLADMGARPSKEFTIERINNDGNYEPGNVRWATRREQGNNRITNIHFEYRDKTYTLAELARETGVVKEVLRGRLCRSPAPWTVEDAVNCPIQRGAKHRRYT